MTNFKDVEQKLNAWKASLSSNDAIKYQHIIDRADGFVIGLRLALKFANQPPNTRMHIDGLEVEPINCNMVCIECIIKHICNEFDGGHQ